MQLSSSIGNCWEIGGKICFWLLILKSRRHSKSTWLGAHTDHLDGPPGERQTALPAREQSIMWGITPCVGTTSGQGWALPQAQCPECIYCPEG